MDPFYRNAHGEYLPVEYESDSDNETEVNVPETPHPLFWRCVRCPCLCLCHRRLSLARCVILASLLLVLAYFPSLKSAPQTVDWTQFAYVQYATNLNYLCNSIMLFESLCRLGSQADRVLVYSPSLTNHTVAKRLLDDASELYGIKIEPLTQATPNIDPDSVWNNGIIKLLSFNQTTYTRVICLDSDATILQSMDELFFLPNIPIIAPQRYLDPAGQRSFSASLLVIRPASHELSRIELAMDKADPGSKDIDTIYSLYGDEALVLPHRPTILMSAELRAKGHVPYLGSYEESWDPKKVYNEAKYLYFNDPYMFRPWVNSFLENIQNAVPSCDGGGVPGRQMNCDGRDLWLHSYADFAKRRREICGFGLASTSDSDRDSSLVGIQTEPRQPE